MARPRSAWDIVFQFSRREGWQLLVSFLHIYSNLFPTCDFRSVDLVLPSDHSIPSKGMNERFNEKDKIVIKGRGNFLPCRGSIAGLARKPIYPLLWKILESCSSTSFVSITYARLLVAASNRPLLIDRVFHPRFPANNPSAVRCCGVDQKEEEEGEFYFVAWALQYFFLLRMYKRERKVRRMEFVGERWSSFSMRGSFVAEMTIHLN